MNSSPQSFVDTSDNFLQRAVDRLEESWSESAIKLFAYILRELISKSNQSE